MRKVCALGLTGHYCMYKFKGFIQGLEALPPKWPVRISKLPPYKENFVFAVEG